MMPLWLALASGLIASGIGALVEGAACLVRRAPFSLDGSPRGHLTRLLVGLALFVASVVHPGLGVATFGAFLYLAAPAAPRADPPLDRVTLVLIGCVVLVVLLRPPVPLVWDELVWLTRTRAASLGPAALIGRALDPQGGLVPSGYPIGAGLLEAAFALFRSDLSAITAGAATLVLVAFVTFALSLASAPDLDRVATACVLAGAPLLWVHLRTGMLDLPLGLFAASFVLCRDRPLLAAAIAVSMAALKDEGAVYVVVASGCFFFSHRRLGLAALLGLALSLTWRMRLRAAGIDAEHHSFAGFSPAVLPALLRELLRAASDPLSFGASTAAIGAAALLGSRSPATRPYALTWILSLSATLAALLVGPDAVRSFALEGTLFPRLVVQLVPLGAVLVGAVMARPRGSSNAPR